jgi:hypothetical protein
LRVLVCAIQRRVKPNDDHTDILEVIPIAGELKDYGGGPLDAKFERLKTSDSNADSGKEGLRIVLNGGKYPMNKKTERTQKAIIEFICDREKTGLEGETTPEDLYDTPTRRLKAREDAREGDDKKDDEKKDDGKEGDGKEDDGNDEDDGTERQIKKEDSALLWNSYGSADGEKVDVLRLTWHTKYACEDAYKNPDNDKGGDADKPKDVSSGWGFFTWFILMYVPLSPKMQANTILTKTPAHSSPSLPTSSSAHGSTTTATELGAGTCCRTATPSATSPTSSRTLRGASSTPSRAAGRAADTARCEGGRR